MTVYLWRQPSFCLIFFHSWCALPWQTPEVITNAWTFSTVHNFACFNPRLLSQGGVFALHVLKNKMSKGSTLAPMLFNIWISDIPDNVSTQYGYADDLALLFSHKCGNEVEEVLSLDMQRIADNLPAWRIKLSTAKITWPAFHLNNRESSRKFASTVPPSPTPTIQLIFWSHAWSPTHLQATLGKSLWQSPSPQLPLMSTGWLNMGCPRLGFTNFSAGLGLQCRGIRRPSLVPQHPHCEARRCAKRYVTHHLWVPKTDFYRCSGAFHRPTCVRNTSLSSRRSRHSWILITSLIPLSMVQSPSAHSSCIHDAPSAAILRRWWALTPMS